MNKSVRGRSADATPHAASLIEGLRDIGYSLETALADIVDNSITANARRVEILTETAADEPAIGVLDDGDGMTEAELVAAMRPGSQNPLAARHNLDLGRFGLGMKSASFSQCRQLTVVSKKNGVTSSATWDLDRVAETNRWEIQLAADPSNHIWAEKIGPSGTLVLWQKLDRISGGFAHDPSRRAEQINRRMASAERQLRLVFHRFMGGSTSSLKLLMNGRVLKAIDPFALDHPATIKDPEDLLHLQNGDVVIQSVTLPHHKQMTQTAWDEIGGPEGHLKSQGFYLYRGRRLILHGTWFGLCRQSELIKLCRVRVDIPNSMDSEWNIDVKKSSAQLPPIVRERLKKVLERISDGSRRTYKRRGQKLVDENRMPLWHRVLVGDTIRYRPNPEHPAFTEFADSLPVDLRAGFFNCVALVGASLPIDALHADMAGSAEQIATDEVDESALAQAVTATLHRLLQRGFDAETISSMLKDIEPFRSSWDATKRIIDKALGAPNEYEPRSAEA
ncbi:MAG: ATP-binding protein [Mesorhizobium sp.]|uniref:ATP-binding protein n=1 Tax=Mesorhizobium sp. TaxID=1871066 RepID=UPI000FE521DF|nr:ATP-binding protein [Mesorhizobium sp.]RWN64208.1 MAG: ATP-binding protein [Mesorhizobium sp.]TIM46724.1 MAG: ATP-binding protein [Mesorhizobium sp.]